jgi:hypothetical protein
VHDVGVDAKGEGRVIGEQANGEPILGELQDRPPSSRFSMPPMMFCTNDS